jgi:hypothetical protein
MGFFFRFGNGSDTIPRNEEVSASAIKPNSSITLIGWLMDSEIKEGTVTLVYGARDQVHNSF